MSNKIKLILIIISLILLPVIYFAANTATNLFSRASEDYTTYTVDPQTGEFYDLFITAYPFKPIIENNIANKANIGFQINGDRVSGRQTLYGAIQKYDSNEYLQKFNFTSEGSGVTKIFKSDILTLPDNPNTGCIDLHSEESRSKASYIATFCYGLSFFNTSGSTSRVYSVTGNPFFETTFNGTKPASIITMTTAFNKYTSNGEPYFTGSNRRGVRVNYFSQDETTNARDFTNLTYTIQGITQGLTDEKRIQLCSLESNFPKKYLRYSRSFAYEGGDLIELTQPGSGGCSFEVVQTSLLGGWMNLWSNAMFQSPTTSQTTKPNNPTITQSQPALPNNALIAYWKMEDNVKGNNQTIKDSLGAYNVKSVSINNDAGIDCTTPGKNGKSCTFNGNNRLRGTTPIAIGTKMTVMSWIKTTSGGAIFSTVTSPLTNTFYLRTNGQYIEGVSDMSSNWPKNSVRGKTKILDNNWHHVAFVIDDLNAYVYVDGKLDGSAVMASSGAFSDNNWYIGYSDASWAPHNFRGQIDDLKIYNYALSASQILENSNVDTKLNPTTPIKTPILTKTPTNIPTKVPTKIPTKVPTKAPVQKTWNISFSTICTSGKTPTTPYNTYWYSWNSANSDNAGVSASTTVSGLSNQTYYVSLSDRFGPLKPKTVGTNMTINIAESNVNWSGNLENGTYSLVFEARATACK